MEIELVLGDITAIDVDAIVTAANAKLRGGGGVDGAVHRAAGRQLLAALRPLAPCAVGHAVVTAAYGLTPPVRHVVHAVGPRYGIDEPAPDLLRAAYVAALRCCDDVGARSVAFPSISTGVYRFPLDDAARISVDALRSVDTAVQRCTLVAFDPATREAWARALQ